MPIGQHEWEAQVSRLIPNNHRQNVPLLSLLPDEGREERKPLHFREFRLTALLPEDRCHPAQEKVQILLQNVTKLPPST